MLTMLTLALLRSQNTDNADSSSDNGFIGSGSGDAKTDPDMFQYYQY